MDDDHARPWSDAARRTKVGGHLTPCSSDAYVHFLASMARSARALRSFAAARFAQALVIYTRSQPIRQAARMARRHATWSAQVGPPFWVTLISNAYLPMRASVLASRPR